MLILLLLLLLTVLLDESPLAGAELATLLAPVDSDAEAKMSVEANKASKIVASLKLLQLPSCALISKESLSLSFSLEKRKVLIIEE